MTNLDQQNRERLSAGSSPGYQDIERADVEGTDPFHLIKKALRYRDENKLSRAEALLKRVIDLHPQVEAGYYELAFIHRLGHAHREAVRVMEQAPPVAHSNRLRLLRGHMLHAAGAHDEAAEALSEVAAGNGADCQALREITQFGYYLKQFPLGRALLMFDRQKQVSGWLDSSALAGCIGNSLRNNAPFAFVRLGDGEGGMLKIGEQDEMDFQALYERNRQELIQMWFGGNFEWRQGTFMRQAQELPAALVNCDVIGVPYESWLTHEYGISSLRGVPSLVNIYRCFKQDEKIRRKPVCSQQIHLDLFQDGHLVPVIQSARRVSIITCLPELEGLLRDRLGLEEVTLYLIPAEQGSKTILGDSAGSGVHYPAAFNRIQAELSVPHGGRLFLVAGGLLGKFYCATIRSWGGIALDVGSLVDGWAGRATRPGYDNKLKL